MVRKVRTEAELGDALKDKANTIEVEGDLTKKVVRIRATGTVAWVIAIGAVGIGTYATAATLGSGGTAVPVSASAAFIAAPAAVSILGGAATYSAIAIAIAIAAGGVGALNKLRGYKQVSKSSNRLVLKRK